MCIKEWDINTVTWVNAKESEPWNKRGGDYDTVPTAKAVCVKKNNWEIYDVSTVTKSIISNSISNYGFIVNVADISSAQGRAYHSSEYVDNPLLRPRLTIYYKP